MPPSTQTGAAAHRLLDSKAARQTIETCAKNKAIIRIEIGGVAPRKAWVGTLTAASDQQLTVRLKDLDADVRELVAATQISVHLFLGIDRFTFDTQGITRPEASDPQCLTVRYPAQLFSQDRRRERRGGLHSTTTVSVRREEGGKPIECALLNVSVGGLACRSLADAAKDLKLGDIVRVVFTMGNPAEALDLPAKIVTITQSVANHIVLGLEFTDRRQTWTARAKLAAAMQSSD